MFDVICIGAALVDMVARVNRHPIEDDEVFVSDLKLMSGGAAANTAFACAILGLNTAFIGKIGLNDTFGAKIISDFKHVKVATKLMKYSKENGTGSAYVALNMEGDRRIYAHSGAANYLSKEDINEEEIIPTKVLFLSSLRNLEPFIKAAKIGKSHDIPVIMNPGMLIIDQGIDKIKILLKEVDILILSRREFTTLMKIKDTELNIEASQIKTNELFKYGIKIIIITMGKNGAALFTQFQSDIIPAIEVDEVVDTTGAGDAFSAGFIYRFAQNRSYQFEDMKNNVKCGNIVASNCIQKLGARNGILKLK